MLRDLARLASMTLPKEWRGHVRTIRAMNLLNLRELAVSGSLIVSSTLMEAFSVTMILPLFQYIEKNRDIAALTETSTFWKTLAAIAEAIHAPVSLLTLSLVVLVLISARQAINYHSNMYLVRLKQRTGKDLSQRLFGAILAAKPAFLQNLEAGKFVNLIDVQAQATATLIHSYGTLLQRMITFAAYVAVMFLAAPLASTIALAFTALTIISLDRYVRVSRRLSRETLAHRQAFTSFMSERFQGWRTIKAYGVLPREERNFRDRAQRFYQLSVDMFLVSGRLQVFIVPTMSLIALAILYVSVEFIGLSVSQISLFVIVLLRLTPVAQNFASQRQSIANYGANLHHVVNILREARNDCDRDTGIQVFGGVTRAITLDKVCFSYPDREEAVLTDIDLTIPAGRMTALMGPSGAGKSTLVDLLSRFVRPTSGYIRIDGIPLDDLTAASFRQKVAYAAQMPFIFNDTVSENVRFSRPDASQDEVRKACRKAFAEEFIEMLPEKYNTVLGEFGALLSVGQRQRLTLARAFLTRPSILILDEPTSSLDYESEHKIRSAIQEMTDSGTTVIVVAHRLSTVAGADNLAILDGGRIVSQGPPDRLRGRDDWLKYADGLENPNRGMVAAGP